MGLRLINGEIVDDETPQVRVEFYEHAKKVGVGQYIPVDYIKITSPGHRDYMSRPATDEDKSRFQKEWEAYRKGQDLEDKSLTPLTALPAYKVAFGLELSTKHNVHTVTELAALPECPFDGCDTLYAQAKRYVKLLEEEDGDQRAEVQAEG